MATLPRSKKRTHRAVALTGVITYPDWLIAWTRDPICRGPKSPQELAPLFPLARKSVAPASSGLSLDRSGWVYGIRLTGTDKPCKSFYPDEAIFIVRRSDMSGLPTTARCHR